MLALVLPSSFTEYAIPSSSIRAANIWKELLHYNTPTRFQARFNTHTSTLTHLTWFPEHSLAESFQARFSRATLNMWHQNATQEAKCGLTIQSDSKKKKKCSKYLS